MRTAPLAGPVTGAGEDWVRSPGVIVTLDRAVLAIHDASAPTGDNPTLASAAMTSDSDDASIFDLDVDLSQHLDELELDESDDDDEPVLRWKDGRLVDTWREGYPYPERLPRPEYEVVKRQLQIELLKLQNWVKDTGQRLVILFEGRDAAGKGGTIKRFLEHLNPSGRPGRRPGEAERARAGRVVFPALRGPPPHGGRDRAVRSVVVQPGRRRAGHGVLHRRRIPHCSSSRLLSSSACWSADGVALIKLWFSVSRSEQRTRFLIRRIDPVRQWKLSPTDLASLDRWDDYTVAKEAMFEQTDTSFSPWTVVKSNDKKRARINAMRYVLEQFDYPRRDDSVAVPPDPLVVGPASSVYEHGEAPGGERRIDARDHTAATTP